MSLQQLAPYQAPSVMLSLDPILHKFNTCAPFDVTSDWLHATHEHDDPSSATLVRPETPVPDDARTLRRTISYASIDTILPLNPNKGIRRRINDIAENLKNKSSKKKKGSSTRDAPKNASHDSGPDSKASQPSKATKRGRKATAPLRDAPQRSKEENVLIAADQLYSGIPSEDTPSTFLDCVSAPPIRPPHKVDILPWENDIDLPWIPEPAHITADGQRTFQPPQTPEVEIKDLQLDIRPSESDMTIWDGLPVSVFSLFPSFPEPAN